MDKAGDNGNRPTPQEVLSALHETVPGLKIRLPQVTPAIRSAGTATEFDCDY